jgi:ribosomal protein L11 methyltransferase
MSFPASAETAEAVADAMQSLGALAVTITPVDGHDILEPMPGKQPLAAMNVVTGLYDQACEESRLRTGLLRVMSGEGSAEPRFEILADAEWEQAWRQRAVAREFGDGLWVLPADAPIPQHARGVVRLDPGLAFGTGAHPTTALCLQWLASLQLTGRTVIDFGCGSGILAIAAAQLGATQVFAADHDPQAIIATRNNAQFNEVTECVRLTARPPAGAHVLVANILANALHELAPLFTDLVAEGGTIGLSGILPDQAQALAERYSDAFEMNPATEADGWILLTGRRRNRA